MTRLRTDHSAEPQPLHTRAQVASQDQDSRSAEEDGALGQGAPELLGILNGVPQGA